SENDPLMLRAEEGDGLVIFLFYRRENAVPQRLHLLTDLGRLLHQQLKAHQRQWLIQAAHDGAHIQTGSSSFGEQPRIDRRLEQRQLAEDAFEVETVANLEEAVRHRIPVIQQLVIARHAKIERLPDASYHRQTPIVRFRAG